MADSIAFCNERHPVIAYFGWICPLCHVLEPDFMQDVAPHTAHDLRRAVVKDYNRVFYVHDDPAKTTDS